MNFNDPTHSNSGGMGMVAQCNFSDQTRLPNGHGRGSRHKNIQC